MYGHTPEYMDNQGAVPPSEERKCLGFESGAFSVTPRKKKRILEIKNIYLIIKLNNLKVYTIIKGI